MTSWWTRSPESGGGRGDLAGLGAFQRPRRYPTHREFIRLTVVATTAVYILVLVLSVWFFDGSRLLSFLLLCFPAMGILLVAIPQLAWNRDHFRARLFLAEDPVGNLRIYARSGLSRSRDDLVFQEAVKGLGGTSPSSASLTTAWLQRAAVVEKSLPARVDIGLDMALLVTGGLAGNAFTSIWSGNDDWSWSSLGGDDLLKVAMALTLGIVVAISQLGSEKSHELQRVKIRDEVRADPKSALARLSFHDPVFAQRFHQDAVRVAHALLTPAPVLSSLASLSGVDLNVRRDDRIASLTDLSFKLWQFAMGLLLGAVASLF